MNDSHETRPATRRRDLSSPDGGRALVSVPFAGSAPTDDSTYDSNSVSGAAVSTANGLRRLSIVPGGNAPEGLRRTGNRRRAAAPVPVSARGGLAVIGLVRRFSSPLSTKNSGDLGLVTHILVSTHAPLLDAGLPADLLARMTEVALALLAANSNRRRVLAAESVSLASRYLKALAPRRPWRLLGVEFETGSGPVDVAWVHDDGRVLFDELKTSRVASRKLPQHWADQVRRYAAAGAATHNTAFAGVRLLPLNRPDLARLIDPDGRMRPLTPTPEHPLGLTGGND